TACPYSTAARSNRRMNGIWSSGTIPQKVEGEIVFPGFAVIPMRLEALYKLLLHPHDSLPLKIAYRHKLGSVRCTLWKHGEEDVDMEVSTIPMLFHNAIDDRLGNVIALLGFDVDFCTVFACDQILRLDIHKVLSPLDPLQISLMNALLIIFMQTPL